MLTGRLSGGSVRDVAAAELDPAGGRQLEAADHPERGRLAAAARAEHREELAGPDVQRHAVDRADVAEVLRQVGQADLGRPGCVVGAVDHRGEPRRRFGNAAAESRIAQPRGARAGALGGATAGRHGGMLTDSDRIPARISCMTTTSIEHDHDPGSDAASERVSALETSASEPIETGGSRVLVGTASWTDPTMTASGVFYPKGADNAEERLAYYASSFPVVEVDATYYALPAERTAQLWAERTPPDFTFDIKAHALMTGQGTETKRLPKAIREALPAEMREKTRIYAQGLPGRAPRRGLADVPLGPGAARGARPARLDPPPVPEMGVPVEREPGPDPRRRGAAGRLEGGRRVPQRVVAQREEPRPDAGVPVGAVESRS